MAGIGFELRKLAAQDNLLGMFRAYSHAAIASSGPWLFTVLALGLLTPLVPNGANTGEFSLFHTIIVYNFGISLIITAPICMVTTRYLADGMYRQDVTQTASIMLISLGLTCLFVLPAGLWLYGLNIAMPLPMRIYAMINLCVIAFIWVLSVYITSLKNYTAITMAFGIGMTLAVAIFSVIRQPLGEPAPMIAFTIGLCWIAFSLAAKILTEYPYRLTCDTQLARYFARYWDLALGGLCYNAAIWVDKCIMWMFAPEAITNAQGMTIYPHYDGAMFLAYLSIVPAMAVFIFSIETNFFIHFQRFYQDINNNKPLSIIRANHKRLMESLAQNAYGFFIMQGTVTLLTILLSAKLFGLLHVDYMQIGIFRFGVLGSFFHIIGLFAIILLYYFDSRRSAMIAQLTLLLSNAAFTYISINFGFSYYGYGYFLSALLSSTLAVLMLFRHIVKLPYHAFITHNTAIH